METLVSDEDDLQPVHGKNETELAICKCWTTMVSIDGIGIVRRVHVQKTSTSSDISMGNHAASRIQLIEPANNHNTIEQHIYNFSWTPWPVDPNFPSRVTPSWQRHSQRNAYTQRENKPAKHRIITLSFHSMKEKYDHKLTKLQVVWKRNCVMIDGVVVKAICSMMMNF